MTSRTSLFRHLLCSTTGNVLPLAAVGMFLSAGLIGGGVDMSRAYLAQNRLQAACDAGVLAGRKAVESDGYNTAAETEADKYFNANFDQALEGSQNTVFASESEDDGNTVTATATAELDTTIMRIFGVQDFDLTVNCTASMGVGNSDIMMVLDNTGSMAWTADGDTTPDSGETTRLQDLQVSMKNFYDTVDGAMSSSNARVRYGFVPYSSSINVGELIMDADPDYMSTTYTVQTRNWYRWQTAVPGSPNTGTGYTAEVPSNFTRSGSGYNTLALCNAGLTADTAWAYNGSATTPNTLSWTLNSTGQRLNTTITWQRPQRMTDYACRIRSSDNKYYRNSRTIDRNHQNYTYTVQSPTWITSSTAAYDGVMYRQSSYNVSTFLQGTAVSTLTGRTSGGAPSSVSSTWTGCIEERQTVSEGEFNFVSGTGIDPAEALDLDIDSAPTSDDATKWKPMWPQVLYGRDTDNPSTSGWSTNSYCPRASQLLAEMDEEDFDDYADSLSPQGATYHDLGLIWGARLSSPDGIWQANVGEEPSNGGSVSRHMIFMTDGELAPNNDIQTTYGLEVRDKRVTDDGSTDLDERHRSRVLALCEAIKGKGIRLWVIAFGTSLTTDLSTCASSASAFAASNSTQLNTAFQAIAKQVGELRVTQ